MAEPNRNSLTGSADEKTVKSPNILERMQEEIKAITHHDKKPSHHENETHGTSEDIDESTPVDYVKGPGVFERIKEEIEAIVDAVKPTHSSKKSSS